MTALAGFLLCVIAFLAGLLILRLIGKLFRFSAKLAFRLLWNALIGMLMLFVFNCIGGMFGLLQLELSPFNALFTGVFGVPGVLFLLLLG